jgi:hypothetical protein
MANFTIRFANRSNSVQDWAIYQYDEFQLQPDHIRPVDLTIDNNYTFQIVVSTNGGYTNANLIYNSATQLWSINSHTPNEWELAQGNNVVTLRCLLENVTLKHERPTYNPKPISEL